MKTEILVLTTYPPRDTENNKKVGGAAHFVKALFPHITQYNFTVISQLINENQQYQDAENITVIPSWKKGSIFYFLQMIRTIAKYPEARKLILNFEFKLYGGDSLIVSIINNLSLPLVLLYVRLRGIKIYTILHPALLTLKDLRDLSAHLGTNRLNPMLVIYNLGNQAFIWFLLQISTRLIQFEAFFKEKLGRLPFVDLGKVEVIPHHIYAANDFTTSSKERALTTRGQTEKKFNILFFGFLVPYKGIDWLVELTKNPLWPTDIHLTVAGGRSVTAGRDDFYEEMVEKMKGVPNITHTGFVPDDEIAKYFNETDLVVLPYRVLLASSGPMATAIGYKKPFIMSKFLSRYAETPDFAQKAQDLSLNLNDFTFALEPTELVTKLNELRNTPSKLQKLQLLSAALHESRAVERSAERYSQALASE